ncbi:hypothetical protein HPP92_008309 [Vanilla planifolia]|uniref:C2H2-type domain-containing protein n=1 Tax=Vanilla planifolia TaxID=51239 RepID=A0A835RA70_VANPL|nr:hypothetical protein HPP92_008309 [Vanilla planifolia]
MPNSTDTMKCAACGCHRSFHRREGESDHLSYSFHHHNGSNHSGRKIPLFLPPPPPFRRRYRRASILRHCWPSATTVRARPRTRRART